MSTRRGDLLSAAFWAALGAAIAIAAWRMDRLAQQGIAIWSAPGLLPGVAGVLMVAFAAVLALQAGRGDSPPDGLPATDPAADLAANPVADLAKARTGWLRSAAAAALCLLFAGVALGRGLPFQAEAAVFVALFTGVFSWQRWRAERRLRRGVLLTLAVAALAALAIGWLFESVFLVRLP